jgi:hypothetical protein
MKITHNFAKTGLKKGARSQVLAGVMCPEVNYGDQDPPLTDG